LDSSDEDDKTENVESVERNQTGLDKMEPKDFHLAQSIKECFEREQTVSQEKAPVSAPLERNTEFSSISEWKSVD